MLETKLKPCPFCGRYPTTEIRVLGLDIAFLVKCNHCCISKCAIMDSFDTTFENIIPAMNRAIEVWNRRTANDQTLGDKG